MKVTLSRRVTLLIAAVCAFTPCGFALSSEAGDLDDLIARVQFDAYAADIRSLRSDLNALTRLEVSDGAQNRKSYFLAYGNWKLSEALITSDRSGAKKAAEACSLVLKPMLDEEPPRTNTMSATKREQWFDRRAEALAIAAACRWNVGEASLMPGSDLFGGMSVDKMLDEAIALKTNNPRVRLVEAMLALRRAHKDADRKQAQQKLVKVVETFDSLPISDPGSVDWGHADALAYLGNAYLLMGNRIAARNSLERALVLAPDYGYAKNLLKKTLLTP
jgi:tetratricopeptide (TPR) repeat protein